MSLATVELSVKMEGGKLLGERQERNTLASAWHCSVLSNLLVVFLSVWYRTATDSYVQTCGSVLIIYDVSLCWSLSVSAMLPCPIAQRATAGLHAEGHLYTSHIMTAQDFEIRGSKNAPPVFQKQHWVVEMEVGHCSWPSFIPVRELTT